MTNTLIIAGNRGIGFALVNEIVSGFIFSALGRVLMRRLPRTPREQSLQQLETLPTLPSSMKSLQRPTARSLWSSAT
jgi:hypothetical protein